MSTFVMIGQNRQAAFQQAKADHDFVESELELKTNTELTELVNDLDPKLTAAALGMNGTGMARYAADNVARDRLQRRIANPPDEPVR